MEEELREFEDAGADAVLSKPLQVTQLEMLLKHYEEFGGKTTIGLRLSENEDGK